MTSEEQLFDLITGYRKTQAIYSAVKLNIIDSLYDRPSSLAKLSKDTQLQIQSLERLVNALITIKIISDEGSILSLTETGMLLATDYPNSSRHRAIFHGNLAYQAWSMLDYSIEKNSSGFKEKYSQDFFSYLKKYEFQSINFNALMQNSQKDYSNDIIKKISFDEFSSCPCHNCV